MSILIKDMEIPKDTCEIRITIDQDGDWWARRIDTDDEWHEVVEVPTPHGLLIDADELKATMHMDGYKDFATMHDANVTFRYINEAQVFVDAER